MKSMLAVLLSGLALLGQSNAVGARPQGAMPSGSASPGSTAAGPSGGVRQGSAPTGEAGARPENGVNPIRFDGRNGWPIVPANVPRPSFLAAPKQAEPRALPATSPATSTTQPSTPTSTPAPSPLGETAGGRGVAAPASGMDFGSPLLDVYQHVRAPGAFRALGGRTLRWRLTVHGPQGESIGSREVTHVLDCAAADRDRLEFADGKVFGRSGKVVFASRQGLPWPTLQELAEQELERFALHARAPWCFGDAREFAVLKRERMTRDGRSCSLVVIERIPADAAGTIGPSPDLTPRDTFEILYDAASGEPLELTHSYGQGRQKRRMRLEDWRELDGVRLPYRRTYVDDAGRPTTTIELLDALPTTVGERMFRL